MFNDERVVNDEFSSLPLLSGFLSSSGVFLWDTHDREMSEC